MVAAPKRAPSATGGTLKKQGGFSEKQSPILFFQGAALFLRCGGLVRVRPAARHGGCPMPRHRTPFRLSRAFGAPRCGKGRLYAIRPQNSVQRELWGRMCRVGKPGIPGLCPHGAVCLSQSFAVAVLEFLSAAAGAGIITSRNFFFYDGFGRCAACVLPCSILLVAIVGAVNAVV